MRTISIALVCIFATFAVVTFSRHEPRAEPKDPAETGQAAMDAIVLLLERSLSDSVIPATQAPFSTEDIRFSVLGPETAGNGFDSRIGSGTECKIAMEETPQGNRVVWNGIPLCDVTPYLEGELPNGMDDNGNGLIDEQGLSFVLDRDAVTIRLTAEARGCGESRIQTLQRTVTFARNEGWVQDARK